jgi:hypothetical protein
LSPLLINKINAIVSMVQIIKVIRYAFMNVAFSMFF